jgi:hypothetical protein
VGAPWPDASYHTTLPIGSGGAGPQPSFCLDPKADVVGVAGGLGRIDSVPCTLRQERVPRPSRTKDGKAQVPAFAECEVDGLAHCGQLPAHRGRWQTPSPDDAHASAIATITIPAASSVIETPLSCVAPDAGGGGVRVAGKEGKILCLSESTSFSRRSSVAVPDDQQHQQQSHAAQNAAPGQ